MDEVALSVVIPAHNEEGCIGSTVRTLEQTLARESIPHEIILVNDHSTDGTVRIFEQLKESISSVRLLTNERQPGFGRTVTKGIDEARGTYVAIMMADASDDPEDLVRFYKAALETGSDCIFGSRFIRGGSVHGYPPLKLILNRLSNFIIQLLLGIRYNDCTNAFKLYKRETLDGLRPFLSPHFNLTVELPLKAVVRGYSYTVLPNAWYNRKSGTSKFKIKELGSRYLFILFYCLIERYFSRGDYKKNVLH